MSNPKKAEAIGFRQWLVIVLIGFVGNIAWAIENMYLNTYITYLNFTAPKGEAFNYSLMIALTTALSAIVATLTTLVMGGWTDKIDRRKPFMAYGYLVWGLATASFGLFNVNSPLELLPISMTAMTAAIMVIVIDCLMTFFGSTAYDAAFNSYVTKTTKDNNRGKVEGVISVLPLIAMLVIFVGLNGLTTKEGGYRWDLFFYIVGSIVTLVGIIGLFLIPKDPKPNPKKEPYFSLLLDGFRIKAIKANPRLYLTLLAYFIFSVAVQVYFPYLMVYVEKTANIANSGSGFLTPFAIVMALALLLGSLGSVIIGFVSDKVGKTKMMIPTLGVMGIGLGMMFFMPDIQDDTGRTVYAAVSTMIMILGYVGLPTLFNATIRKAIPKGNEGAFMGIRALFMVLLPMVIGPFIGDALNQNLGGTFEGIYGETSVIPTQWGYIVAIGIMALTLIPILFLLKLDKKEIQGRSLDSNKN